MFSYSVTFWLGLSPWAASASWRAPFPALHELPGHELVAPAGWLLLLISVDLPRRRGGAARTDPHLAKFELPLPSPADRLRPARGVGGGLGAGRRGALRAAAEERAVVPGPAGRVPGRSAPRAGQPRAGRRRRLRGLDGAAAQALPVLGAAPARAGRLPPRLLPAAAEPWPWWRWWPTSCANAASRRRARAPSWVGSAKRSRPASWPSSRSWRGPAFSSRARPRRPRAAWPGSTHLLPLGVVEASHFLGSLVGAGLLLVSQGLSRRLDAAYYLAAGRRSPWASRRRSSRALTSRKPPC